MSDPDHFASVIKRRVNDLAWNLRRIGGDFDNLEGRIMDGQWSREFDLTAADLKHAETELRSLADAIKSLRERFLHNMPQAAE